MKAARKKSVPQPSGRKSVLILTRASEVAPRADDLAPSPRSDMHSLYGFLGGRQEIAIDLAEAKKRWAESLQAVQQLIESSVTKAIAGWELDEIEVGLALTAKGKLAFIAEAGIEASIHLTFKRRP
jgi:hypothetical protein